MLTILIKYAGKECEILLKEISKVEKQSKELCSKEEFHKGITKIESRLVKAEEELKMKKSRKSLRDQMDYEKGQILTFGKKYDQIRVSQPTFQEHVSTGRSVNQGAVELTTTTMSDGTFDSHKEHERDNSESDVSVQLET
ncbi:hypothetical protein NDU88_002014 [Pleurodeles waltl]|uniref:Uncharacterized protein n=1 Tax=Pleurodeles waltl TaxID=8319 RepID=A0AAV7W1T5_PLEWA|nr:hypothetical protein NDU88_002014 [Pleurodeles waltl]